MNRSKGFTSGEPNSPTNLPVLGMPTDRCEFEWLLCLASAFQAEQRQTREVAKAELSQAANPKAPHNLSDSATLEAR
jgi:hypothetical protein